MRKRESLSPERKFKRDLPSVFEEMSKFEREKLSDVEKMEKDKTVNFMAVVRNVKSHTNQELRFHVTDPSIHITDPNIKRTIKFSASIQAESSDFNCPDIPKIGDILMIKGARIVRSTTVFGQKINCQLSMKKNLNFLVMIFEGISRGDYIPKFTQKNKDYLRYTLTEKDKIRIYELRNFVFNSFCKVDQFFLKSKRMNKPSQVSQKKNYNLRFDFISVIKERIMENQEKGKITFVLEESKQRYNCKIKRVIAIVDEKFRKLRQGDIVLVKRAKFK